MASPRVWAAGDTTLEEVTVTANRLEEELPQELAKSGTRVETISAAQIRDGGYADVASALQSLAPGLYLGPKNGPFDYVDASFQGSRTGDILWLVDGVRINNRLYNGTTPLDTLPASMVERIEIIQGGQALFYGTQAVAGAINIVTKGFTDQRDGLLSLGVDTNSGRHVGGYVRDGAGRSQFVVYGSADKSSGFQPFRTQDYQASATDRERGFDVMTLGVKYAFNFSEDLRLSINEQHTEGKLDYASPFLIDTAFNERTEELLTAKLDATINDHCRLFVKPYYHWWHSHYTQFDNTVPPSGQLIVVDDHDAWGYKDYGANFLSQFHFGKNLEYFAGYDVQNYGGNDAVLVIAQHTESTQAVFGQIRTTPELIPRATLAAGVRYSMPSVGQSATVWNVSGKYDVTPTLFVRGQAGTAFRLPTAEELFANDPQDERGNPDLKAEESTNANLSVGGRTSNGATRLNWEVGGFYRQIRNLIDYATFDSLTQQAVFGNVPGTVRTRGGELTVDVALDASLSGNFDFVYSDSIDPGSGQQLSRVPRNIAKVSLDFHPHDFPWGATLTADHTGITYRTGLWDGTESYGNRTVVDFSVRYFIDPARHQRLNLALENAFGLSYATGLGTAVHDADGSSYTYWNLGVPRTLHLNYTNFF